MNKKQAKTSLINTIESLIFIVIIILVGVSLHVPNDIALEQYVIKHDCKVTLGHLYQCNDSFKIIHLKEIP